MLHGSTRMKDWPDHFPAQCPPIDAEPVSGEVFRFVGRNNPKAKDFSTYYELKPEKDWGDQACQARGLSVYRNFEVCKKMSLMIPALAKKKLAVAVLEQGDGNIATTPSRNSKDHNTFWSCLDAEQLYVKFSSVEFEDA